MIPPEIKEIIYNYYYQLVFSKCLYEISIRKVIRLSCFDWNETLIFDYKSHDICVNCGNYRYMEKQKNNRMICFCDRNYFTQRNHSNYLREDA
jgi:hypothetical protein